MQKINRLLIPIIALITLLSCQNSENDNKNSLNVDKESSPSKELISLNNQGVGEMGYFDYDKAVSSFEILVSKNTDWDLAQQNYAIALLNRQKPGDEEKSIEIAHKLLLKNPNNLVADYILGILNFNQGLCDQALPHFEKIISKDEKDSYALYFAAQCHLQNGLIEQALELYQKSIIADNYLRSAYYGGFMAAQRLEKPETAEQMLDAYQKLAANPKAKLAEIKYTRMGPKAITQAYNLNITTEAIESLKGPFFNSPIPLHLSSPMNIENFGVVDFHQSGSPYIYLVSNNTLIVNEITSNNLQSIDKFTTQLPTGVNNLAWGDINNDNLIDFYVTGNNDQLFLQTESGFNQVNMQEFQINQQNSSAIRMADTDHDGDLDLLLLTQNGEFKLLNNNLNNTFTDLSNQIQIHNNKNYTSIFIQDIDKDRDADILLLKQSSITTLLNNRMWDYHTLKQNFEYSIKSLSFSDNNINGIPEINLLSNELITSYEFSNLTFEPIQNFDHSESQSMLQIDINGSGVSEYLTLSPTGINILNQSGSLIEQINIKNATKIKSINSTSGSELIALNDNKLIYISASNRNPFLFFNLSGKEDKANSVRSNYSGIGTSFTLHNQGFYSTGDSFHNQSGTDQDFQSIAIAAGTTSTIDFLALEWSDGVYQTELNLSTKSHHHITETQRQLSSCPVIFVWKNGKYEFVSDVLGVGGIGFAIGKNQYGTPRPWENYLLNQNQLSSDNGVFKLQFTEPMEESAYLDQLQIEVIDIPKQWSVILDERMAINEPLATGNPLYYQTEIQPINVETKSGKNVTKAVLNTDKIAIDLENTDHRFLGLVDEQIITMEFESWLQGDYTLIMNGWVEYGYSQTMFAAWQAGISARAPSIEVLINGEWTPILTEFGYPAGMPRQASVPLSIPGQTQFLRIKTNMEIYFDKLSLIKPKKLDKVSSYSLKLKSARLHQLGFPLRSDNKQRVPDYDFNHIKPFWDTRYMQGAYSQIGNIKPLVESNDNAVAIIGAGEAIEFEFVDDLPKLADENNRYFILKFNGWAKDMDILTKDGQTLEPIPFNGQLTDKTKILNNKYNTRFQAGK